MPNEATGMTHQTKYKKKNISISVQPRLLNIFHVRYKKCKNKAPSLSLEFIVCGRVKHGKLAVM